MSDSFQDSFIRKTIRIEREIYNEIEKISGGNFNRWVGFLIDRELKKDRGASLGKETEALVNAEKLDDLLDKQLLDALNKKGGNVLSSLTDLEIAKLAAQRAPKAAAVDVELEENKLSLHNALKRLPDIPDLRKELIRVKGELSRLQTEYEFQVGLTAEIKKICARLGMGETPDDLFNGIRDLCQKIAEKSYDLREEDQLRDMVKDGIRILLLQVRNEQKSKPSGTAFR